MQLFKIGKVDHIAAADVILSLDERLAYRLNWLDTPLRTAGSFRNTRWRDFTLATWYRGLVLFRLTLTSGFSTIRMSSTPLSALMPTA
ncbi:hypothetical protein CHELA1G11_20666 [Hyphomicrobiales bacterium]|nr:hypothetical protein CHELA1G11_20666 [Hyphomicrobiales bacterium]CAH1691323.1 hypothetical protein CHELA1G2_20980 [Hyphomicrobiales bacterium]